MSREPIWDEKTMNAVAGDSDLKQCGWCIHRGCGAYRYNCMLDGVCSLLKSYKNEVQFDTECKVLKLGKSDIADIVKHKEYKIAENESSAKRLQSEIESLKSLDVADSPALPDSRKANHFNIGDSVMVYIKENPDGYNIQNQWISGKVISGYRHHDGCMSVHTDTPYHKGDYLNGCGYSSGLCVPFVLLKSEYDYFANNQEQWKDWIETACSKSFNGTHYDCNLIKSPCEV